MKRLFVADYIYVKGTFQANYGMLVEAGVIKDIGRKDRLLQTYVDAEVVDWSGKAIIPGTVNAHNHSFQSLLRGIAVDRPFLEWRDDALYKYTPMLDEEAIYTGALLAFGEMLKYGATTVSDFFYVHHGGTATDEAVIQAAQDTGIRLVLARTMYDWEGAPLNYRETVQEAVSRTRELAVKYQGNDMVSIQPAPHSPHASSPEMIQAGYRLARELHTPFHIHVAEEPFEVEETLEKYGRRPVHYLESLGVVDENMIAIHLVWLEDSEITLLGEKGAALAYCPSSNMFLSDGITRIPELAAAGVRIALGSDGACSNNRISVFEEMRMCSLLQKVATLDGTCVDAQQVFQMGTKTGGQLLKLEVGELRAGYKGDFVTLDLADLSLAPKTELLANIVYSMQPTAIKDVAVDGKIIVREGKLQTVSEKKLVRRVEQLLETWSAKG
ncbi:5-methylthioadenosine/S-adenosylhomocysteine deaminase [Evansella caseinilytica]|uniref:5-methylthioadenosine/S-adenosylhomocysteine deaminase n=1 Tax=Evansella caseinilytica TaxID=1503961 RepID=A0A1H3SCY5_9BACI|nr:amidohydrolase [Evansella caseinilytica]SDZ35411.1 5-methylthioadenosine/S-adenosylhomocysteine deaminase [Evansella caseinilytica]